MAVLVSKQSANIGDANVWYRAEAYNFGDTSTTVLILSNTVRRYIDVTFANAGNCLGVLLSLSSNSPSLRGFGTWNGVYTVLEENLGTCTTPVASPGIVTKAGHGYTGAKTVTITTGTPGVINLVGHGLTADRVVGFTTSGAFTGITAGALLYVVPIDANSFSVAAYPAGPALAISAASGTISMWDEWCEFTTTGALPTGLLATSLYCVKYINANTFNVAATAGGTNINFTGSTSGTHSLWTHRRAKGMTAATLANSSAYIRGTYVKGFDFDPYAVDTTASKWRFAVNTYIIGSSSFVWALRTSNTTAAFYVTWCDTAVTYSDTNDAIIIRKDVGHVITINQSIRPKPYLGTGATAFAYHGIICSSNDESIANIAGLVWENPPSSSYTYTMDGGMKIAAGAAFRCGTSASRIPNAQKAVFTCLRTPTAGATAGYSGFQDGNYLQSGGYYFDRANIFMYGEIPTVKQCRLVSNAATAQKDLVVDSSTGFVAGDLVFAGKQDIASYASTSTQSNNTIASVAGNTITMTNNLLSATRLGRTTVGTVTISEATPAIVTLAAHGLFENEEVCFETTGALPTGLTATTGYYFVHKIDANSFNLRALRSDSTYIATSSAGSGTHTCYRAGGHVTRANGYGIEISCDQTATGCIWACHCPANLQFSGVRAQNFAFYGYSAGAYSVPYFDLANLEAWRIEDCFFLGYARAVSCGFASMSPHPALGYYFNRNVLIMNTLNIQPAFVSNSLSLDVGSRTIYSGPFYCRDNYKSFSNSFFTFGFIGIKGNIERNTMDHCSAGFGIIGNAQSYYRYNYSWGANQAHYLSGGVDIPKTNITLNVHDNIAVAVQPNSASLINCGETNNVFAPTKTQAGYTDLSIGAGGYYLGEAGYTIENPSKVLSTVSTSFYTGALVDWIPVSKFKISNNGNIANYNVVYTPEGNWRTTGDGLADTTVHSSGAGKFAWRLDPLDIAYNRAEKKASIPTGNIQGYSAAVGIWCKINSAAFYAGTYELPRLSVNYDNGTTSYAQAAQSTDWQFLIVPFTPATSYAEIYVTLSARTNATFASTTTAGNSSVYWDDFSWLPPAGLSPLNLGAFDLWANAEPIQPYMSTPVFAAADVWAADPATFGDGTIGAWVNKLLSVGKFLGLK